MSKSPREIEYAGYLLDGTLARVENHPQFAHMQFPPEGYVFTQRPGMPRHVRLITEIIESLDRGRPPRKTGHPMVDTLATELFHVSEAALGYGACIEEVRAFFRERNVSQNTRLPQDTRLAFVPTVPYTLGSTPWVLEIEDTVPLFFPHLHNGDTAEVDPSALGCYPVLKALLETSSCKAIITHVRSTAESLPVLFESETIQKKVAYSPIGIKLPDLAGKKGVVPEGQINLLFTNSWHQIAGSFYIRGGLEVLEAFSLLADKYPQLNLFIRSAIPRLNARHAALLAHPRLTLLSAFLSEADLRELMLKTDLYLLPSARLHVMSVVRALAYGLPVIASDGWGMSEYVADGETGIIIPGRYGITSWIDETNGMLRENYNSLNHPHGANPEVVAGLMKAISTLVENTALRNKMSAQARQAAETKFSLDQWNRMLKQTFDSIFEAGYVKTGEMLGQVRQWRQVTANKTGAPSSSAGVRDHQWRPRRPSPKVSVILLNPSAEAPSRALYWLNRQSAPRMDYELIWVAFANQRVPEALEAADIVISGEQAGDFCAPQGCNLGLLHASGAVVTIADGEAVYPLDFIKSVIEAFFAGAEKAEPEGIVLRHYERCTHAAYPTGLADPRELGRYAWLELCPNVGTCLSARRLDILRVGGLDEDENLQRMWFGPDELGIRLVNLGLPEIWCEAALPIYRFISTINPSPSAGVGGLDPAIPIVKEAFETGRILPRRENPALRKLRLDERHIQSSPVKPPPRLIESGYQGYNIVWCNWKYYALAQRVGKIDLDKLDKAALRDYQATGDCLAATSVAEVKRQIHRLKWRALFRRAADKFKRVVSGVVR